MDLLGHASKNITERLTWCTACKDQAGIAKDLADGKDMPEVYGLGETSLFDEFFYFLEEFKILDLFKKLDSQVVKRDGNVKLPAVILMYWILDKRTRG